ncbi:hypothetical protein NDA11_002068 [Ustilago hordei]|nr:hypothetical protein NDA11_002068 [Ustilago hordei]
MRRVTYLGEECGDDMVLTTGRRARDYQDARAVGSGQWAVGSGQWAVGVMMMMMMMTMMMVVGWLVGGGDCSKVIVGMRGKWDRVARMIDGKEV